MAYEGNQKTIEDLLNIVLAEIEKPQVLEYVSIILSVVAILISCFAIIYQIKLNNANLQSTYFEEIFGSYLKTKIPKVMRKIDFDENGKLRREYREINKVFMAMIRESGYFKYVKNDFYVTLCSKTQELDEYLVEIAGQTFQNKEQQDSTKLAIHKKVENIVMFINKKYQHF